MSGHQTMSMEAALDEERLSVLALLESSAHPSRPHRGSTGSSGSGSGDKMRASSPFTANPRSPVRSMLDISEEPAPRHASIAGTNGGITAARPIRSMLDIDTPPAALPPPSRSTQTSPTDPTHKSKSMIASSLHPRSKSDAAVRPTAIGHRAAPERSSKGDVTSDYQFSGYLPSNPGGPVAPKRNTLAGKLDLKTGRPSSLAAAMRGEELAPAIYGQKDRGRNQSTTSNIGSKSRSPHNRLGLRSNSPSLNLPSTSNVFKLDSGAVVDINNAYRRLSDANLALSGGSLATLSNKGRASHSGSGGMSSQNGGRLEKDYSYSEDGALNESSDDDNVDSSDEEGRGRKKDKRVSDAAAAADADPESSTIGMGRAKGPREAKSLMAAAEEERQKIAQIQQARSYKVRSLLDPDITVTGPTGSLVKNSKPGIHPTTAFDQGNVSGSATPMDSDTDADISDIRRAQKLAVIMTPIQSTRESQRCIRTIYRGDFAKMQQEAEDDMRRVRKYLVATDLSDEAAHALEWTVGTVLRDGDTLLAIYCVDEETGIVRTDELGASAVDKETLTAQAASVAAATAKPSAASIAGATMHMPSPLAPRAFSRGGSTTNSPASRGHSHAEQERYKAVEDITERVAKLLRKTKLQVRVVIEVIHCKSPKHLITEVIDFISPTLVILGSRGRSALKGVILGSFSNYLVTKSSVPVMVARKRLRKHGKYRRPAVRLANNLTGIGAKTLASAKID